MKRLFIYCVSCLLLTAGSAFAESDDETLFKRLDRANELSLNSQNEEALIIYNEVLTDNPDNLEALFFGGMNYLYLKDYPKAAAFFERADYLKPDLKDIYPYQAMAYMKMKKFQKAADTYSKAIKFSPNDVKLYELRGIAYMILAQKENAKKDMEKVLQLNPSSPIALEFKKHNF